MSSKSQQPNRPDDLTRREFLRDGAATAAGVAVGLGAMGSQQAQAQEVAKTRSYSPEMEYRPLGKTGLWVSAICLGGHWKRIEKMVPTAVKDNNWLAASLDDEGFKKNRRDVVTRCIESGINYIDACTREEVKTYAEALRGRRDSMYLGFSWYQEELALDHELAGIGCERCHGESLRHRSDEANVTPPEIMYPKERINPTCMMCHPRHDINHVKDHQPLLEAGLSIFEEMAPAGENAKKYCTDCHGVTHRMKVRSIRWDKATGALLR